MTKIRLDNALLERRLVTSRSQAESWIKLGKVLVDGKKVSKAGYFVDVKSVIELEAENQYVSRAGLKLESVAKTLKLDFRGKTVLDIGSSTGGFTDYSLRNGAQKVYAVDVGTDQLHPSLRGDKRIELHEKTDIRDVFLVQKRPAGPVARSTPVSRTSSDSTGVSPLATPKLRPCEASSQGKTSLRSADDALLTPTRTTRSYVLVKNSPDIVVIDVSFISLRDILPHIHDNLADAHTQIVAMVKPQFEAGREQVNKGIIKNEAIRRQILRDFETWSRQCFVIIDKRDSEVAGSKGNRERFYLLKPITSAGGARRGNAH